MSQPNQTPAQTPKVRKALISTVQGTMVHLYTNQTIGTDPKLVEVDAFTQAQLDAGKWVETKQ